MTRLYFWIFNRVSRRPGSKWTPLLVWVWRRTAAWIQIGKHLRRGNWGQALSYLRIL